MTDPKKPLEPPPGVRVEQMPEGAHAALSDIIVRHHNAACDEVFSVLGLPSSTVGVAYLHTIAAAMTQVDGRLAHDYFRWIAKTCLVKDAEEMDALNLVGRNIYQRFTQKMLDLEIMRRESGQERPS